MRILPVGATPPAGSACPATFRSSCGALSPSPPTAKNLEASVYGRQILVVLAAASGSRHCRLMISGEFRKSADLGRFNLWRPTVVDRTRRRWVQVQPALHSGNHASFTFSNAWIIVLSGRAREGPFSERPPLERSYRSLRRLARQAVCFIDVLDAGNVSAVGVI